MDQALIEKYLKVKNLALRGGTQGEKDAAQTILKKMEGEHPGLSRAASAHARKQKEGSTDEVSKKEPKPKPTAAKPSGVWEKTPPPEQEDQKGNWENIFRAAQTAFNGFYGFAENVTNAYAGRELGFEVEPETKMSKTGSVLVTLKIPMKIYNRVTQLNGMQKAAFRQTMHEFLDAQLDTLFGENKT